MHKACVISLGVALAVASVATSSYAEGPVDEPIDVRVQGGILCTNAGDFFQRVRARTSAARPPAPGETARAFTVEAEELGVPYRAHLVVHHLDGSQSSRTLEGGSCEEVVDALALVVALDIDPQAATSPDGAFAAEHPRRAAPPASAARWTAPADRPSLVGNEVEAEPWQLRAGVQLEVTFGILPTGMVGVPVVLEVARPSARVASPAFALGFERTFNAKLVSSRGDASLDIVQGFVVACPASWVAGPWRVSPCARLDIGALNGSALLGKSVVLATPTRRTWAAASALVRAGARLFSEIYLDVQVGLGAPLVSRYELQLDPELSLGRVGAWHWRGVVGLELRFL